MKRKMFRKLMAASLAAAMATGMAGCGGEAPASAGSSVAESTPASSEASSAADASSEEEVGQYTVLTDENGNTYDLGGMEIIIRNWWSGEQGEPKNDYEEALFEYRDWIQETYNFTIKEQAISDWASTPQDFVDYASTGGDENYVFVLRDDPVVTSAMSNGLMYDLSTLDCLDFTEEKFTQNKLHEQYSYGDKIYAMYAGVSEPRTGVYFNKRLLEEANIDPESIYDMQKDGTWTWEKFEELMAQAQRDIDSDGVLDVYGVTQNASMLLNSAVYSNGGEFVGKDSSGNLTYELESPETLEALEWQAKIFNEYVFPYPQDAQWDYYKEAFKNGQAVFMVEDGYAATPGNFLEDMADDFGFVMFPKGPQMDDYVNCWSNNPACIPACYDAEKAWKIAFAWNLFTDDVPGYEDYQGWTVNYYAGMRDTRAVEETAQMMVEKGFVTYHSIVPSLKLGEDFTWGAAAKGVVISEKVEAIRDTWKGYIDAVNQSK